MKNKMYIWLLACLLLLVACSEENTEPTPRTQQPETTNSEVDEQLVDTDDWQLYSNGRFGFTINYPSSWLAGEEAENGDGKQLYTGELDMDIRAYGAHYMEEFATERTDAEQLVLNNGNEASLTVDIAEGRVTYHVMYISSENIEYHFYADVEQSLFDQQAQTLLEVAKTLSTPK